MMILVTGGAGFIGSNLAEELLKQGHHVRILDNFDTGNMDNLKGLDVELVRGDIRDMGTVRKALDGVEQVYHQAALGSVPRSIMDPLSTTEVNVTGTLNILTAARDSSVEKIVYASSSSVYAGVESLPKREKMKLVPTSIYGATKITNELYFKVFHEIHGMKSVGMRYFNVFGPKQRPDSEYAAAIPKFIKLIMNDEAPVVFGDGEQTRDFTFVKDVVKANILAMKAAKSDGSAYNVAGGKQISLNSVIEMINGALGKKIEPKYAATRPGDPKHSLADISKATHDLGFRPDYDFDDGLKITVDWFRNLKAF
jgi:nucleoside-diphosphate-sugar epimerase